MPKDNPTVAEMRDQIAALTGRIPTSHNESYLRTRLADLLKSKENGEDVRNLPPPDRSQPFTISMISQRLKLLDQLCDAQSAKRSEILRRALDLYATQHGHREEVEAIQRTEAKLHG